MANNIISQTAWAKINLDLLITGRRDDGYHLLDSLVVFADYGDEISVRPAQSLSLDIAGPFSGQLGAGEDNIILQAAHKLQQKFHIEQGAQISLVKNLPVSSGIGGGSADAAATLRALMKLWDITDELGDLSLSLGADVPACMVSKSLHMSGIGEKLNPVNLDFPLHLLLVNPGVAVSTAAVFDAWIRQEKAFSSANDRPDIITDFDHLGHILNETSNDLRAVACGIAPVILDCMAQIEKRTDCHYVSMSGSGATCFGLFPDIAAASHGAENILCKFPEWWVQPVAIR